MSGWLNVLIVAAVTLFVSDAGAGGVWVLWEQTSETRYSTSTAPTAPTTTKTFDRVGAYETREACLGRAVSYARAESRPVNTWTGKGSFDDPQVLRYDDGVQGIRFWETFFKKDHVLSNRTLTCWPDTVDLRPR